MNKDSKSVNETDVIIIGAGIAGLSLGNYLQANGYTTRILEMIHCSGGVCVSWKRKGYTFDGATNWLPGAYPASNLYELLSEQIDFNELPLYHSDVFIEVHCRGKKLVVYKNADRLRDEMLALAPEDHGVIDTFINGVKSASQLKIPFDKTIEVAGVLEKIGYLIKHRRLIMTLSRWKNITIADFATKFTNKDLQECFLRIFPDHGFFSIFGLMMALGWMHIRGEGYPLGGSEHFTAVLEKRFLNHGGEIIFNKKADRVLFDNNQAIGVHCTCGTVYKAHHVVSAADSHETIFNLLKGQKIPGNVKKRFDTWKVFPSVVTIGLGVNRSFDKSQNKLYCDFDQPLSMGAYDATGIMARVCSFDPAFAPPGKTSICIHIRTHDYQYWVDLRQNDSITYEEEKKRVAEASIALLEREFAGISNQIEVIDVSTPATYIRYTNNWKGSYQAWAPTPRSVGALIAKRIPGLKKFYMTGHWLWPGGGLPAVIRISRDVAAIICHTDKKPFKVKDTSSLMML